MPCNAIADGNTKKEITTTKRKEKKKYGRKQTSNIMVGASSPIDWIPRAWSRAQLKSLLSWRYFYLFLYFFFRSPQHSALLYSLTPPSLDTITISISERKQ